MADRPTFPTGTPATTSLQKPRALAPKHLKKQTNVGGDQHPRTSHVHHKQRGLNSIAIAKDSNVSMGTRLRAAGDAMSDKMDQHRHEVLFIDAGIV